MHHAQRIVTTMGAGKVPVQVDYSTEDHDGKMSVTVHSATMFCRAKEAGGQLCKIDVFDNAHHLDLLDWTICCREYEIEQRNADLLESVEPNEVMA